VEAFFDILLLVFMHDTPRGLPVLERGSRGLSPARIEPLAFIEKSAAFERVGNICRKENELADSKTGI
jgi:hypothetical protein